MLTSLQAQVQLAEHMRMLLAPFILRRLKSEVASQLTLKTHKLLEVWREAK
jgi:SNF2 family DNA or RNA helicase